MKPFALKARSPWRSLLIHGGRVFLLACILFLMHRHHSRVISQERAAGLDAVPLTHLQALFPDATGLGSPQRHGGRAVVSGERVLGSVIQTFPEAERFLGFSGPTNTLIALNENDQIQGIAILSSRDTRDHVSLIQRDSRFLTSLNGLDIRQASEVRVDAVTGATLTSLAILQGIQARLGKQPESLKFPATYTVEDARQFFPEAVHVQRDRQAPELWLATSEKGEPLGWLLSNSPASDEIVGYQGPTRAHLGMRLDGKILGLVVKESYDNEPYVGTVREDAWFARTFNDKPLEEWAKNSWEEAGIEGVSGATMTSQAVAEGLLQAARKISEIRQQEQKSQETAGQGRWKAASTIALVVLGLIIGLTRLRGITWLRTVWQVLLIVVMGLINADLLSMAMFVGWAESGIPWRNAIGLTCLTAAALVVPVFFRQNIYCDHLCPHGALQQLLPRRWKLRNRPRWMMNLLQSVRPFLLLLIVLIVFVPLKISLVDLEPFDAYAWRAAGIATISIAIGGLLFSLFIPMGYCRYGCPTGAVLGYLRRHSQSNRLTRADGFAFVLTLIAAFCV